MICALIWTAVPESRKLMYAIQFPKPRPRKTQAVLLQLRVLRVGFLQDGNIGVGILPESEKVLILRVGFGCIALERVGAGEAKMGQHADRRVQCDAAMAVDILEL